MKLLVLGATGRTGNLIMQKALADGHHVVAIVREPDKLEGTNAEIIKGTPYDREALEKAMPGCDAVICALNVSRTSDSPWSKLRAPKDLISKSINHAIAAMEQHGVSRLISLSVLGIGDTKRKMPFLFSLFISMTYVKYAFIDHERQEQLMQQSNVDWTAIRLPLLTDKEGEREVLINKQDDVKLKSSINRESVARFVLSILDDPEYFKKIAAISNA